MFRKEVATETSGKSCFRTPFGNQRVNGFQTPLKVARDHLYPLFPWISGKLSWKKTVFTLIKNLKTVCEHIDCRWQVFLPQYAEFSATNSKAIISKTEDSFLIFYCISEIFTKFTTFWKKGWVSSPNYFRNYCFGKRLLLKRPRKSCLRTPFDNQRVNGFQTPLKVARHHYYPFFPMSFRKIELQRDCFTLIINLETVS